MHRTCAVDLYVRVILCYKYLTIMTDSKYILNCTSSFGDKYESKHWDTQISNKYLVQTAQPKHKNRVFLISVCIRIVISIVIRICFVVMYIDDNIRPGDTFWGVHFFCQTTQLDSFLVI